MRQYLKEIKAGTVLSSVERDLALAPPEETSSPDSIHPFHILQYRVGHVRIMLLAKSINGPLNLRYDGKGPFPSSDFEVLMAISISEYFGPGVPIQNPPESNPKERESD